MNDDDPIPPVDDRESEPIPLSRRSIPPASIPRPTIPPALKSDSELEGAVPSRRMTLAPSSSRRSTVAPPPMAGVKWAGDEAERTTRRIGTIATLIAALLMLVAIFADMLASDMPIACKVDGHLYLFPNVTQVRGVDPARADWKVDALVAHGPKTSSAAVVASPGSAHGHPFGTDTQGRDVFARVVHGTRAYLVFALAAIAASLALGVFFGALAGLFGGATDAIVSRAIESISAFPPLVLVLGVQAAVPSPTILTLFLAIALTRWPEIARLVRGEVIQASTRDYALAARALGASPIRVLRKHIMPNVRGPLIVAAAIGVSAVVVTEASLDFLRIGPPGGAASWGETMSEFRDATHAWWLLLFPGVLIVATVIALTLVGEALRDRLDPRSH